MLVVEDETSVARVVLAELERRGFRAEAVSTVAAALDALRSPDLPDVVVIDLNLPDGSGVDVLVRLRSLSAHPHVVVTSGHGCEDVRIRALDLGADDFVSKPFSVAELGSRIAAISRRRSQRTGALEFPGLRIDLEGREVTRDGTVVEMTPMEFDLLACLASSPGHVFSRAELLRSVWGSAPEWQMAATVTEHVRRLRLKLEADPHRPRMLATVRGSGYRFDPVLAPARPAGPVPRVAQLVHIDGLIVTADGPASELLGLRSEEIDGRSIYDFVAPESLAAARTRREAVDNGGWPGPQLVTMRRADGTAFRARLDSTSTRWRRQEAVAVSMTPIEDPAETDRYVPGVATSVSEAVVVTDGDGFVRDWNRAAERLYGWRREEAVGREVSDVIRWAEPHPDPQRLAAALQLHGRWFAEGHQLTRDGSVVAVTAAVTPLEADAGRPGGAVWALRRVDASRASSFRGLLSADELQDAVLDDQLTLHYQPIVDLADGSVCGVEALIRWEHPVHGLVPPGAFLGLAERNGLIVGLGRQVLRRACRQAAAWRGVGGGPDVAVNLSPTELADAELVPSVTEALRAAELPADALCIDVSESILAEDRGAVLRKLRGLVELGVRIAIDDFGTGWSTLTHLRELPVHYLKLDHSLVASVDVDPLDAGIVRAVVALAAELELDVIAEGIERRSQLDRLREVGCGFGQGFLLGEPGPPAPSAPEARPTS